MHKETDYNSLSWTDCFNNNCLTYQLAKDGAGWYPQAPTGQKTLAMTRYIQLKGPKPPIPEYRLSKDRLTEKPSLQYTKSIDKLFRQFDT